MKKKLVFYPLVQKQAFKDLTLVGAGNAHFLKSYIYNMIPTTEVHVSRTFIQSSNTIRARTWYYIGMRRGLETELKK